MTKTNPLPIDPTHELCSVCGALPTEEAIYHTRCDGWICGHCMDYRSRKAADTIKALEAKNEALNKELLNEATWAKEMQEQRTTNGLKVKALEAKLERYQMMLDQAAEGDTEQRDKVEGLLEQVTWANKEIAILDRKHTDMHAQRNEQRAKVEELTEALKDIAKQCEHRPNMGAIGIAHIQVCAGKAAGLPGY